jgi:excisionase family DNA binding protein
MTTAAASGTATDRRHRSLAVTNRYPWLASPQTSTVQSAAGTVTAAPVPRLALTTQELAAAIGVSPGTITTMVRAGTAPPSMIIPNGRLRRFPVDGAREWLAERARAEADGADGADGDTDVSKEQHS